MKKYNNQLKYNSATKSFWASKDSIWYTNIVDFSFNGKPKGFNKKGYKAKGKQFLTYNYETLVVGG